MQIRWVKRRFCFYVLEAELFISETSTFEIIERQTPFIKVTKSIDYESSTFEEKLQTVVSTPLDAQAKLLIVHGWKFARRQTKSRKRIWETSDVNQTENLPESGVQSGGNEG